MSRRVLAHKTRGICHILGDVIIKFNYSDRILIGESALCITRSDCAVCNSYSMRRIRHVPEILMRRRVERPFMNGRSLQHAINNRQSWVYHNANSSRRVNLCDYWVSINISHMIIHDIERVVGDLLY